MTSHYAGLGVSPGIALGRVWLLHAESLPVVPLPVPPERLDAEIERFNQACEAARDELEQLRGRVAAALGEHYAGILGAQLMILEDPGLLGTTVRRIRIGRVSARWALKEVIAEFSRKFEAVDDPYLRERGGDLSDVHHRLQRILSGATAKMSSLPEGPLIVVAHSLGPSDLVSLLGKGVVGLVTDVGGRTSHTAILAQALSVPAVAALHDFSRHVENGDPLIVDGTTGEVQHLPDAAETARADARRRDWEAEEQRTIAAGSAQRVRTLDDVEVVLRANIEFPREADVAMRFGAQGIGLYRSEFLFLSRAPTIPSEEEHYQTYLEIARRVAPHPAVIRTLDLGGEKYFHEVLDPNEPNPVLGLRGVRFCLQRPDIFRPQLRGLLRAAVEPNLRIMLPLVTIPEEVREVRRMLAEEAARLHADGVPIRPDPPLGIMIEVPAAALAADLLASEVDFFSVGTNDLLQYALAADRGNESVSYLYQPRHPGVLRMLEFVVASAEAVGIPVSVCGEMAADPEHIERLVGLGLRELSVQPRTLAQVRNRIAEIDAGEAARRVSEELSPRGRPAAGPDSARLNDQEQPGGVLSGDGV